MDAQTQAKEGLRQLELASFPTAKEWAYWWRERKAEVEMSYGWERALIDAITLLQRNNLSLARQVRLEGEGKKMIRVDTEGHVYGEEMRDPAEYTREALLWYMTQVRPQIFNPQSDKTLPGIPDWASILGRGVQGCFIQQARLGIELSAIKKKGYLTLNASATMKAPTVEQFREQGLESAARFTERTQESV